MFQSDNQSGLTTQRVMKATKNEGMKPGISWTSDQSAKVNAWARGENRSKNGTIPSFDQGQFGRKIK